jgi:hypothetical protein
LEVVVVVAVAVAVAVAAAVVWRVDARAVHGFG